MIALVPIGDIEKAPLLFLKQSLGDIFGKEVIIGSVLSVPESAYNPARAQYFAPPILEYISNSIKGYDKVLGIIACDLWSAGLNFIFGEVDGIMGRTGIISIARLRQEFYDLPPDKDIYYQRTLKEAVHEIGHLYGLTHCYEPRCVMHFSNSLQDTDIKNPSFCINCKKILDSLKN